MGKVEEQVWKSESLGTELAGHELAERLHTLDILEGKTFSEICGLLEKSYVGWRTKTAVCVWVRIK